MTGKLEGHKCKPTTWFQIACECGWHSSMWRADSAGKKSAYNEWNDHIQEEKRNELS